MDWRNAFEAELDAADQARLVGNEARARVSARRAAGIALREHRSRQGIIETGLSAYDLIQAYRLDPALSSAAHRILDHLVTRVDPDHTLPIEADLVAETRQLPGELGLLSQNIEKD